MDRENESAINAFERTKRTREDGLEYWMAREIMPCLGYYTWENFSKVIDKARVACESSGVLVERHFRDATKVLTVGNGSEMAVSDTFLTRYACYLIAMNSDPRKPEIALAQTYFAVQARRQELQDSLTSEERRIELREKVRDANKALNSAARRSGVQNYAIFTDYGYRGLYGGLGAQEIKKKKRIEPKDNLLDRAGRVELAANYFRITQTEEKLVRERVRGESSANHRHFVVGKAVRNTIKQLNGTMPEELPPEIPIGKLISKKKKVEHDAKLMAEESAEQST